MIDHNRLELDMTLEWYSSTRRRVLNDTPVLPNLPVGYREDKTKENY